MMTPAQLMAHEFKSAGRNAYKADDVDAFFGEVAVNYERLYRENTELSKRIGLLAERVEQYKSDETEIKQAVISAQKAANIIVKEAEESVAGAKDEAEAIIAAARQEADQIKADAERQAIADSELLLSISTEKAEEIIAKAKEKAHEIIIEANEEANKKLGAANRTVTSETIHFDMLKKEVSEFKASILSQYKTHIELISKLPEIAVEEAQKLEQQDSSESADVDTEATATDVDSAEQAGAATDGALEFVEDATDDVVDDAVAEEDSEEVVQTQLPYDFFAEDTPLEFVDDEEQEEAVTTVDEFASAESLQDDDKGTEGTDEAEANDETESAPEDIPISKKFSVNVDRIDETDADLTEEEAADDASQAAEDESTISDTEDDIAADDNNNESSDDSEDEDDSEDSDSPRSNSFFGMFERIDSDEDDDDDDDNDDDGKKPRRGFFRRKK